MKRAGLVTCAEFPDLSPDDRPLLAEFASIGWEAAAAVWDDPRIDWSRFDLLILRSTWDYHLKAHAFRRWIDATEKLGIPLLNPSELVRWNLHKSYLAELEGRGVSTPQTVWVEKGSAVDLAGLMDSRGWKEAVVKPAVSAGAWNTFRVSRADRRVDQLAQEVDVLVQEFLPEVVDSGELSLIFIGGSYSHAVRKRAAPGDFRIGEQHGGSDAAVSPPDGILKQAGAILDRVPATWLYARVDGVERNGALLLVELELIEPYLFFKHRPEARRRFVSAAEELIQRVRGTGVAKF